MAMPSADLTGIERKNTLSCGAVRLTRPRPMVARNITMITGADITTVVFSIPSSAPSTCTGAFGAKATKDAPNASPGNTGQTE